MIRVLAVASVVAFCLPVPAADACSGTPLTIDRVWYRGESKSSPFHRQGTLTLDADRLEFVSRKRAIVVPYDEIHVVSFGTMKGDVDTDWVVVARGGAGDAPLFGLREGRKLGYGGRTGEIFETLKCVLRGAGAGQFDVPPGYRTFEGAESQFLLAAPESWTARNESVTFVDGLARYGRITFTAEDGGTPALTVERRPLEDRRSGCDGLSSELAARLDPAGARAAASIDGCRGVRFENGVAVAHGDTLFVIEAADSEFLEQVMSTFRFAASRTPG